MVVGIRRNARWLGVVGVALAVVTSSFAGLVAAPGDLFPRDERVNNILLGDQKNPATAVSPDGTGLGSTTAPNSRVNENSCSYGEGTRYDCTLTGTK